jgi:HPt (histidine-containing phosphotransfer) domain-containing protein
MTDDALDADAIDALADMLGGDVELVREMINDFVDVVPARLAEVRQGIESGDADLAGRAAHTLKSNALTFGALHMADTARQMETSARAEDLRAVAALLPILEGSWEVARPLLLGVGGSP